MKILVRKRFKYTLDNNKTHTLDRGEHDVSKEVADLAISFRYASAVVPAKKEAPENKVVAAPENKVIAAPENKAKTKKQAKEKK